MSSELILLLHPDEGTRDRLGAVLHESGYQVLTAVDEVSAQRQLSQRSFLLPQALVMPLSEDGPLFDKLRRNPLTADLPVVVLSEQPAEDRRRALRQGLTDLVGAPFDREELLLTLRLVLRRSAERLRDRQSLHGSLSLLPIVDLLQTLEAGRRSGVVELRSGSQQARIWLHHGQPMDAEIDDGRRGEEAVYGLVHFEEGTFEVMFGDVTVPKLITTSLTGLLLEGMRRADEGRRDREIPHAALPDQPPRPTREVLAAHRALTLLNVASAYALDVAQPGLLAAALDEARRGLLPSMPELASFELGPAGQISLGSATADLTPERLVLAAAGWAERLFARLERALPGRFPPQRLLALTEAVREDMQSLGFDQALGLKRSFLEEAR
jgi:DNA-binding response OmpR family regulator